MTIAHQNAEPDVPVRTVLIGAGGFIGRATRRLLEERGSPVLALSSADVNLTEASASEKLQGLIRRDDSVVMLAALTPDKGKDIATLMKNLAMMQNLCAAVEKTGCSHLVYVSSDAVYDTAVSLVDGETPASPQDLYGVMHYAREIMARSLTGVPTLVLRPTLVYGAGDTHNSYGPNRFRRAAQKDGRIALFGGGEETRDHIHVDDVAAIVVRCLLRRSTGTLNVATGRSTSFHEVAQVVARQYDPPVAVAVSGRTCPVTHRHYDVSDVIKAFPDIRFTLLGDGVSRVHRQTLHAGAP